MPITTTRLASGEKQKPEAGERVRHLINGSESQYVPSNLGYFISFWIFLAIGLVMLIGMLFAGWNLAVAAWVPEWYGGMANLYVIIMVIAFFLSALWLGKADLYEVITDSTKNGKTKRMGNNPLFR